ncbi:MAG TPA: RDD family protein [Chloroflexota bacterium]|nr:RDD family protein [Chloroflexota bacterium]
MDEMYRINAPEAVTIGYRVAGIGSRFVAAFIDALIILAGQVVILIGTVAVVRAAHAAVDAAMIMAATLSFSLTFGYYIAFETLWRGRTPGKRVMGLRVLRTSGYPISFVEAVIRNLVRIADFLPTMYGIGVLVMFISSESRRLGDYAAGTVVVKDRPGVKLKDLTVGTVSARAVPRGSIDPDELAWDLDALTFDDIRLATDLLARLPRLTRRAGGELTGRLADRIAARIGAREPGQAVEFLQRVVELHANRQDEQSRP